MILKNFWMNIFKDERRNLVGSILIADDFGRSSFPGNTRPGRPQ